jgi:ATP-dependent Clp endopeptidase proteolytic subunit ClpP
MNKGARPLRSVRRLQNVQSALPRWYNIAAPATADLPTLVSIYDEIGFYGVSSADFLVELQGIKGDIELHVNSPGGDVFDGIAIYNQLKQRTSQVHIIVDGLAASAASFICMAASPDRMEIAPHAQMMIHDGFGMAIGNAADMRATADLLDSVSDEIAGIYAERTGKPQAYWREKMQAETWLSDSEAVTEGLADRIHGKADDPSSVWDMSVFSKQAANTTPPEHKTCASCKAFNAPGAEKCAACGDPFPPKDAPAADTASRYADCPSCLSQYETAGEDLPEFCAKDGTKLAVRPSADALVSLMIQGITNADVDNSAWDASRAWAAGAASDDPAAFYKGICAGRKAGDPATQDAWALPYKYSPTAKVNAAGVRGALARFSQAKGLTNEAEAKATLESAMKLVNPDWAPDDQIDAGLLSAVLSLGLERTNR